MARDDGVSFEVFERLAPFFTQRFLTESVRRCPDLETDPSDSLKFFLHYAFEHQGRSPDYAPAAIDTTDELKGGSITRAAACQAWQIFRKKLNDQGLNAALNPMCPVGTPVQRRRNGKNVVLKTKKFSAVEFVAEEMGGGCIVPWARDLMKSANTKKAHDALKTINGVSTKIASLFLRDVAVMYRLAPSQRRELLQPVDTWIRFVAGELAQRSLKSDDECARFIVNNSHQPEAANQGIWYFCAQIAGSSRYEVRRSLGERHYVNQLLCAHLRSLTDLGRAAGDLANAILQAAS